jgi:hypothetical protein
VQRGQQRERDASEVVIDDLADPAYVLFHNPILSLARLGFRS